VALPRFRVLGVGREKRTLQAETVIERRAGLPHLSQALSSPADGCRSRKGPGQSTGATQPFSLLPPWPGGARIGELSQSGHPWPLVLQPSTGFTFQGAEGSRHRFPHRLQFQAFSAVSATISAASRNAQPHSRSVVWQNQGGDTEDEVWRKYTSSTRRVDRLVLHRR
jgi:hypothetical protein